MPSSPQSLRRQSWIKAIWGCYLQPASSKLDQPIPLSISIRTSLFLPPARSNATLSSVEDLESHSRIQPSLVPIRVEFETDTMRVRDCFVWNQREALIKPEDFANIFCQDLDLPAQWVDIVAAQIKTQLEEHEGVANLGLGMDGVIHADSEINEDGPDIPECRVILGVCPFSCPECHHLLT